MSSSVIQTDGLTKIYKGELGKKDFTALEDLNLEVKRGEIYAFIGPNGAGKTTTIKLLMRLIFPSKGKAMICGMPNTSVKVMEKIGFLPEQPRMYEYLSGAEYLDFIGSLFSMPRPTRRKRVDELIEKVGLAEKKSQPVRSYSRGMMQRLGLAQALMNDPELLILDEPMASLDPLGRKQFRDIIIDLKNQGKTLFFSSHILSDAELIADRAGILFNGRLIKEESMDKLFHAENQTELSFSLSPDKHNQLKFENELFIHGERVLVRLAQTDSIAEAAAHVEKLGGKIHSVVPQRKSLEDIFLDEIKR